ncbi:hypothetical protein JTE90_003997 [Oedothorax gibbosus]|uniref:C2H2-type domain-containing protein n=1 Tax=Oedothorax gibbosus TaxID=931172 RepID=A0AAV6UEA4_9ARAC|nr:hypothetical protein JTE90_003997 [Oedothorax gibbosus]
MPPTINNDTVNVSTEPSRPKPNGLVHLGSKGESLQQLSTNALPPYCPVPPPIPVKKSYEVNCCLDCGDSFSLKSSLKFHLERRSVLIKFPCDECQATKVFYNRCNLLSHIRSHIDKGDSADISRAVVSPLPRVFMDGLQVGLANTLDEELNSMEDANTTTPTELVECSLKEGDEESYTGVQNRPFSVLKLKCLDCNEEFESTEARKKHLTNDDKIPVTTSTCNTCGMVCASKCQLKAHQRLHLQVSPYVCPECGESPDYYWANFQHHVKYKCFHNCRSIGYKCPVCKRVSPSNDSLLKHMELHYEKYLKCEICIRAYTSPAVFEEHKKEYHAEHIVKSKTIYKCTICDVALLTDKEMHDHCSVHLKNQICEYVFNCMQCGKSLENKSLLYVHIKSSHSQLFKHIMQTEIVQKTPTVVHTAVHRGKVECILCNCSFHSFQGYSVHINRAHINVNQQCSYCFMIIGNRKEMVLHGKKHLKKGHVVCLLCNNKKCDVEKNLEMHLAYHVNKLSNCSACPVCNELLPTTEQALKHIRVEHLLTNSKDDPSLTKTDVNSQPETQSITCHFCRTSFAKDDDLQEHLRTKHSMDQPRQPTNLAAFQETEPQPPKKPRIEGNVCGKCNFQSTDRTAFKEHIATHKTNKNTFQCQECGHCFVVEPALTKHLRISHRIDDTKRYLEEEGSNFVAEARKEKEVFSCDSLICSVCFKTFTTETALKTHMRSHGMAFIQANKSSAAN